MRVPTRLAGAALVVLATVAIWRSSGAQPTFTVDAGTASIRLDSAQRWSAATLTPALHFAGARLTLNALATVALLDGFGWTSRGVLDGSYVLPLGGSLQGEVTGLAEAGRHDGLAQGTGQLLTQARAHWLAGRGGAWLGGGVGRAWNADNRPVVTIGDLGAWVRLGEVMISASVLRKRLDEGMTFRRDTFLGYGPDSSTPLWGSIVEYTVSASTDAATQLRWTRGIVELDLSLGRRFERGTAGDGMWGGASGLVWMGKQLAVVASAGTYPGDLAQRLSSSRYASVALRVVPWGAVRPQGPAGDASAPAFEVREAADGQLTLVLRVRDAAHVELMGSFTDWKPRTMQRGRAGEFRLTLAIPRGTHRVNVRIDGGDWRAPPGLTAAPDEFLGAAGILVVR